MKYFDRKGSPMATKEWAVAYGDVEGRTIGDDIIEGQHVSTIWRGLDRQAGEGPPLIFETMIFGGSHNGYCERYPTEREALAGHQRTVQALQSGESPVVNREAVE